ncbi:MAG: hypothetical protein ABI658_17610 [Acidimicrobiales bacterium]
MVTLRIRSVVWFAVGIVTAIAMIWSFNASRAASAIGASESTFVPVTPVRILDTRDPVDIGLVGPFVSALAQDLQVTGSIATTIGGQVVVPAGATGVVLNVTAVSPTANGFVSIRPANAPGAPTTSSLNVVSGVTQPNAVTVSLPTTGADIGKIEIAFDAYGAAGPTTDILIDVVGYSTHAGLQDLDSRLVALEANVPIVTTLSYNGENSDTTLGDSFELLRTVDNITKQRAGTTLRLDWSSQSARGGAGFCNYQLRIDGKTASGSNAVLSEPGQGANVVTYAPFESISTFGNFTGVTAGVHSVQIWVRGDPLAVCTINNSNFFNQVLVEEYQAG